MKKLLKTYGIVLFILAAAISSCKKPKSDIGAELFKETKNKIYKKVDSSAYYKVFKEVLEQQKDSISNSQFISDYYAKNDYEPHFIMSLVKDQGLKLIVDTYGKAGSHGLNPEYFNYSQLGPLVDKLYGKKEIKTAEEAYQVIARTEIQTANSLMKYAIAMKYGVVNPRKIFARYYMDTARPDEAFMNKVFEITDIKGFLDSIQPASAQYKKLQQALASNFVAPGMDAEQSKMAIKLNLERLRWQNKPSGDRYVWVNIPDYTLTYFAGGKPSLKMKVCVGKGPEQSLPDADYDDSEGAVRPFNHTTPQLNSMIYNSQVNPVWNIPESIAKNEIYKQAARDPYYLANNNIEVFTKGGEKVESATIDWSGVSSTNMPYSFKQKPGDDNSLGKIKFQFKNNSSVYLHDTPAQAMFGQNMRAVSHGCVRVEKPLELARALYGEGEKFQTVSKEMEEKNPSARDIPLTDKIPVYLDYQTCFVDEAGAVQIRKDVYKLDEILARRMKNSL